MLGFERWSRGTSDSCSPPRAEPVPVVAEPDPRELVGDHVARLLERDSSIGITLGDHRLMVRTAFVEDELLVTHNLGGHNRPRVREAAARLREMRDYAEHLLAISAALRERCASRRLTLGLYVHSAQMDFAVARWQPPGDIEYLVVLDD